MINISAGNNYFANSSMTQFTQTNNSANSSMTQFTQTNPNSANAQFGVQRNPNRPEFGNITRARDVVRKVPEISFAAFLREKGYSTTVTQKGSLFRKKKTSPKTIHNAPLKEKLEYGVWKKIKEKEKKKIEEENQQEQSVSELFREIERASFQSDKTREDYKKQIIEEQEPYFDDSSSYNRKLKLDEQYPELVKNVTEVVINYPSNFKEPEEYAAVKSEASPDGSYNEEWVTKHIKWMITPDGTEPNLRSISAMGRWVMTDDVEGSAKGIDTTEEITKPTTDKPTPRPKPLMSSPKGIPMGGGQRGFGGEQEFGNIRIGAESRGGILGGSNYSNPYDMVENEFRYRDRNTQRQL